MQVSMCCPGAPPTNPDGAAIGTTCCTSRGVLRQPHTVHMVVGFRLSSRVSLVGRAFRRPQET